MAVDIKKIASTFGFDVADEKDFDFDKFKAHVDSKYLTRDAALEDDEIAGKITGKRMGSIATKLGQAFGFTAAELKEKKIEDLLELGATNLKGEVATWKTKAETGANDRVKELEKAVADKEKDFTELKTLHEGTKGEFDTFKKTKDGEIKSYKLNHILGGVKAKVPFIDGFNEDAVRKTGFNALIDSKYEFDLGENDEVIVRDKATKGRIKHPTKTGDFMNAEDVFTTEAEANKLLKKNNVGPKGPLYKQPETPAIDVTKKSPFKANAKAVAKVG